MSTRAVDLQNLMFRMQDVQQLQTNGEQQPQVTQSQLGQAFVKNVEQQKEQVQSQNKTEGSKVREEEQGKQQRGGNRRQQRQRKEPPKQEAPPAPVYSTATRIDVWV